jgi:two-component system, OmpR family, sensor histidine kinase KdpD
MPRLPRALRSIGGPVAGIVAVAALASAGVRLHANHPTMGYLCLLVVVLVAMFSGFWEATVTSLVAVTCLNYFFIPPVFTFQVADPVNWAALGAFEGTALIVSRLSTKVRDRARTDARDRRNMERLYNLSRRVLFLDRRQGAGPQMVCLILDTAEIEAVALFDATAVRTDGAGTSEFGLEQLARDAYFQDSRHDDEDRGIYQRALRLGTHLLGGLALSGKELDTLTADAIASLTAIAIERARSFEKESHAEAARQSEQLRTAVLDSLAHAFKTPLTAIRTASSGLLEMGNLDADSAELVFLIDEQSKHLDQLTSDLLQMARIDAAEVRVRREWVPVPAVIEEVLAKNHEQVCGHRFEVHTPPGGPIAYVDRPLLSTALLQLVDNAAKYSTPGSTITVSAAESDAEVVISVHNEGPPIPAADCERIFDRFYRASESRHRAPGTGLGLSIAKKTAEAHHGRVWVVSDDEHGTTFHFGIPKAVRRDHEPVAG